MCHLILLIANEQNKLFCLCASIIDTPATMIAAVNNKKAAVSLTAMSGNLYYLASAAYLDLMAFALHPRAVTKATAILHHCKLDHPKQTRMLEVIDLTTESSADVAQLHRGDTGWHPMLLVCCDMGGITNQGCIVTGNSRLLLQDLQHLGLFCSCGEELWVYIRLCQLLC